MFEGLPCCSSLLLMAKILCFMDIPRFIYQFTIYLLKFLFKEFMLLVQNALISVLISLYEKVSSSLPTL